MRCDLKSGNTNHHSDEGGISCPSSLTNPNTGAINGRCHDAARHDNEAKRRLAATISTIGVTPRFMFHRVRPDAPGMNAMPTLPRRRRVLVLLALLVAIVTLTPLWATAQTATPAATPVAVSDDPFYQMLLRAPDLLALPESPATTVASYVNIAALHGEPPPAPGLLGHLQTAIATPQPDGFEIVPAVGLRWDAIDQVMAVGDLPSPALLLRGRFDADAMQERLASNGYTATGVVWVAPDALASQDDSLAGIGNEMARFVIVYDDGYLALAPSLAQATLFAGVTIGAAGSLEENPEIQALLTGVYRDFSVATILTGQGATDLLAKLLQGFSGVAGLPAASEVVPLLPEVKLALVGLPLAESAVDDPPQVAKPGLLLAWLFASPGDAVVAALILDQGLNLGSMWLQPWANLILDWQVSLANDAPVVTVELTLAANLGLKALLPLLFQAVGGLP